MTIYELDAINEEYSIPLDISDIIAICREYNKLGWQLQNQVEAILELGVEEAINTNAVNKTSLPYVKNFLKQIIKNPYFGDAASQAKDCMQLINIYEEKYKINQLNINSN